MPIKILVNGANGKMGSITCNIIENTDGFKLIAKSNSKIELKKQLNNFSNIIDTIIDFTTSDSVYENSLTIIKHGIKPIIGTSGLNAEQIKKLQFICKRKQLGGIIVPNFSIGAMLMMQCAKLLAKNFASVEIIEYHHDKKLDKPSATAKQTSTIINLARIFSVNPLTGKKFVKKNKIPIHSIRLPGLLAHQQIIFGSIGETISIKHDSISRECFINGILFACKEVFKLNTLIYGLERLLF